MLRNLVNPSDDLNLNDFVEFKSRATPRSSNINKEVIRYRIEKNPKVSRRKSLKIYFYEKIANHLDVKKGDRVRVLHDAGNSCRVALIKVTDGTNAGCAVCSPASQNGYFYFKMMIENVELNVTDKVQEAKTVYHTNGRILFFINQ